MSISKEQRQELRKAASAGFNIVLLQAPTENVFLSSVDLRCLLDMADERDKYQSFLRDLPARLNNLSEEVGMGAVPTALESTSVAAGVRKAAAYVYAALEGKHD